MLRRIEVMVKMQKKVGGGPEVGWGGQGGCEQRIEFIVKMQKRSEGGPGGVVRVDVNTELKLL